jgi:16S rRNA (cytosine1402-N4)-methyltransferase
MKHIPVMLKKVIDILPLEGKVFVDVTLGSGGHSLEILEKISKDSKLVAIDSWNQNIINFELQLKDNSKKDNVIVVNDNFSNLNQIFEKNNIQNFDFLLADLGWSTDQLESVQGLSWSKEEDKLDMRLDETLGLTAADLLNILSEKDLKFMLGTYADVPRTLSHRLVAKIMKNRPIEKVGPLNRIVESFVQHNASSMKSRVYQALRIAVNTEFENLKQLINNAINFANINAVIALITFHSGEERLLLNNIIPEIEEGRMEWMFGPSQRYFQPDINELKENISSRSAKLWVIKVNGKV